jgi:sterol desaturase/sphingolipid hydroxylase (fatty acid hydroxylase superfamily)
MEPFKSKSGISTPDDVLPAWYIRACYSKNPWHVLKFLIPVEVALFAFAWQSLSATEILLYTLSGVVIWTFYEYWLHRSFFHWTPKNPTVRAWVERIHIHHRRHPNDLTQLNAGIAFVAPQAGGLYLLLSLFVGWTTSAQLLAGVLIGYYIYEIMHYTSHAHTGTEGGLGWIRKYHRLHHHADWNSRFGVSQPFWDFVFGTAKSSVPKNRIKPESEIPARMKSVKKL